MSAAELGVSVLMRIVVATGVVLSLVLALSAAQASALTQRGHAFAGSFGERRPGEPVPAPTAIAVNSSTTGPGAGDVYVVEGPNNRVVRYAPGPEHGTHPNEYVFVEAWGYGVLTGEEKFEKCATTECKAGREGTKSAQFSHPTAIAVDSSTSASGGDVYVVENETGRTVDKFSPDGTFITTLHPEEAEGPTVGVAVDSHGTVWLDAEQEEEEFVLQHYDSEVVNKKLLTAQAELEVPEISGSTTASRPVRPGLGIDGQNHLYITYEPNGLTLEQRREEKAEIQERERERKKNGEPPANEKVKGLCEVNPCHVAELELIESNGGVQAEEETENGEVDPGNTLGLAVDPTTGAKASGNVYLDDVDSLVTLDSHGKPIQRFGEEQLQDDGGRGMGVNLSSGELFVGDAAAGKIDVYPLEPPSAPTVAVETLAVADVTASSAKFTAMVDPHGLDTSVRFRYGTSSCAGGSSGCEAVPAPPQPGVAVGKGYEDTPASSPVAELSPSTIYHVLAVATNASGVVESEERTFTTLPTSGAEAGLPDGRAWELVSPPAKHGAAIESFRREGGVIQAATSGSALTYVASAPAGDREPEGNRGPEPSQLISRRSAPGDWHTQDLALANETGEEAQGIKGGEQVAYKFFSSDLARAAVFPLTVNPHDELHLYLRDDACLGSLQCVTTMVSSPGVAHQLSTKKAFGAGTPDLQHAVLRVPSANISEPAVTTGGETQLYEWSSQGEAPSGGHFKLVSVLPDGEPASGESAAGTLQVADGARYALSNDGKRAVWVNLAGALTYHLYDSTMQSGQPVAKSTQVDVPAAGLTPKEKAQPVFQTANATGSKVFFTDDQRLTGNASTPETAAAGDLYVYEPEKPEGERVTDLTPDPNPGEDAAVQGGVIGASEDGATVYFVANGALEPGQTTKGNCVWEGSRLATCNLYVVHDNGNEWESPHLVAKLSNEDGGDWGQVINDRLNWALVGMTSRVSPNGRFLAFMSSRRLTGYNNTDANSGVPDEEVFLYDATSDRVVCASCDPTGAQPVGVLDTEDAGEGLGLLIDRPERWSTESFTNYDHWLAANIPGWNHTNTNEGSFYQPSYLNDEGRLFFNSPDALVKQAGNGKANVFEYEPTGLGSCRNPNAERGCVALISSGTSAQESAFMDASESGDDVFFVTTSKLAAQDSDTAPDVYDARVCGGPGATEPCPTSSESHESSCEGEGCRSGGSSEPNPGSPASSAAGPSGNLQPHAGVLPHVESKPPVKLTKAQLLAKALKACRKLKKHSKRAACEKAARKKYAPAKKAKRSNAPPRKSNAAPSRFDAAPSRFDAAPSRFDAAPSRFDAAPSRSNAAPSRFDAAQAGRPGTGGGRG